MTLARERLQALFDHPNIKAFYAVVRRGESSLGPVAYTMVNGGPPITDFSKHPYEGLSTKEGGRAAGAAQFIPSTWAEIAERYSLPDFSPASQDLGYVGCLLKRPGAVDALLAGRFEEAVAKCRLEWTSLPGAAENHAGWDMDKARALYVEHGGRLDNGELLDLTPAEGRVPPQPADEPEQPKETAMPIPAIIGAIATFGPAIAQLIPILAPLFDKKAETPAKVAAASRAVEVVVQATGAVNEQDAVTRLAADPTLVQKVTAALVTDAQIMPLLEISSAGLEKAREQNAQMMQSAQHWWQLVLNPVLIVTVLTLPLIYIIVLNMVTYLGKVSGDVIAQTIGTVIGLVLGGIMGFWMGQTYTNSKAERRAGDAQPQGATK